MSSDSEQNRITNLETQLMHLEHQLDQLNHVILKQQGEIDSVNKTISHLEANFERLEQTPEDRDPSEERPPHY